MLNPKSKRSTAGARSSRFAEDDADREDSIWSSLNSVAPPLGEPAGNEPPRVRLLRTSDLKPSAPRLQDFFPREPRAIERWVVFWDPGRSWPAHALADLAGEGGRAPGATRLAHAEGERTFAVVHHTLLQGDDGRLLGVLHIEADAADAASADVALMLLERSDHAAVLTGYSSEYREVPRRLQQFCGQGAWRGPAMQFVIPQDKPSRADRLRRVAWPRSMDVRVVEASFSRAPGWLAPLLERVTDSPAFRSSGRMAPVPAQAALDTPALPLPAPFADEALAELPARPALEACARAADVAALAPATLATAVLDACSHAILGATGDTADIEAATRIALQLWGAGARETAPSLPLDELLWQGRERVLLAQPLPEHPGLLLVSSFDREHADFDLRQARWQLAVARHDID